MTVMPHYPRQYITPPPPGGEMEAKVAAVETRANAALAVAIVVIGAQVVMAVFMFKLWLSARASRRAAADEERGHELGNVPRGQPAGRRPRAPQASPVGSPIGSSPGRAGGRPVAAYDPTVLHGGQADTYLNEAQEGYVSEPAHVSRSAGRQPTWTYGSGEGEQSHGADYSGRRRSGRYDEPHRTNRNDADYGRRGNRFAHGT